MNAILKLFKIWLTFFLSFYTPSTEGGPHLRTTSLVATVDSYDKKILFLIVMELDKGSMPIVNFINSTFGNPSLRFCCFQAVPEKSGQPPNNPHIFLVITFRAKGT